jgi:hypothetical protein
MSGFELQEGPIEQAHHRSLDGESIAHFHRRLDSQGDSQRKILIELNKINKALVDHIAREEKLGPALEEMAEMWGRSKAIAWLFTKLASFIALAATAWVWIKDHVK